MSVVRCKVTSKQLNCGCCDAVFLECDREEHTSGLHSFTIREGDERYSVKWRVTTSKGFPDAHV